MHAWERIYASAVAIRALLIGSMGMVHPDEYFQCPEVMAKAVFQLENAYIPWEYQLPLPNRSIFFPYVYMYINMQTIHVVNSMYTKTEPLSLEFPIKC